MGIYNVKITEYHNEIQLTYYSYGISKGEDDDKTSKQSFERDKQSIEDSEQNADAIGEEIRKDDNRKRSTRRSKQSIYELARANDWGYFATFTFKDNRYDYKSCKDRLRKWMDNFKQRKCSNFEWLCVPEQHKDGAYHFHSLLMGDIEPYLNLKGFSDTKYVFNNYRLGICELEPVKDTNRVSMYITKYISKDLLNDIGNARRYFYSKGCQKPVVKEYYVEDTSIEFLEKNFPYMKIAHVNNVDYGQNTIQYIQLKENNTKNQEI